MPPIEPLSEVRKSHIQQVLRHAKGDLDQASRILGVSIQDLYQLLASYGLEVERAASGPPATLEEE